MIRLARPDDGPALAAIYAPIVRDTSISFESEPPSAVEMASRVQRILRTHPWLVAEAKGALLGYAYASPHRERAAYRWSVDVTVYVDENARRKGAARALYARLFEILAAQNFAAAFAGIALPNDASVGLHEALGFRPVGVYRGVGFKAGAWRDVGWWGRDIGARRNPPPEPILLPALPPAIAANAIAP
ncbi:MAG TPA: arsinothricin resistance N-acetyltransferase ArsN1 family B [Parvularculaceae bacterium]|nr:arsinothricin resistance N-acetyltransferase ArsN1 family B [Parvularculaceae bacterium]